MWRVAVGDLSLAVLVQGGDVFTERQSAQGHLQTSLADLLHAVPGSRPEPAAR